MDSGVPLPDAQATQKAIASLQRQIAGTDGMDPTTTEGDWGSSMTL